MTRFISKSKDYLSFPGSAIVTVIAKNVKSEWGDGEWVELWEAEVSLRENNEWRRIWVFVASYMRVFCTCVYYCMFTCIYAVVINKSFPDNSPKYG